MECQLSTHQAAQEDLVASLSWMTPQMKNPVFKENKNIFMNFRYSKSWYKK
jgi:hypothetical protein